MHIFDYLSANRLFWIFYIYCLLKEIFACNIKLLLLSREEKIINEFKSFLSQGKFKREYIASLRFNLMTFMLYGFFLGDAVPRSGRRLIFCNAAVFSLAESRAQKRARGLKMNFINSRRGTFKDANKNINIGARTTFAAYIYTHEWIKKIWIFKNFSAT